MNIVLTCCAFLCFGFSPSFANPSDWVDNLTRYIIEDSETRQVILVTNHAKNEKSASLTIDLIFAKLMQSLPTLRVNLENLDESNNSTPNSIFDDLAEIDTSASFILFVLESRKTLPILPSNILIDAVLKISASTRRNKYLLLYFTQKFSDSHEQLLQYAWNKKMLDFTIVESTEPKEINNLISTDNTLEKPIIHRLNSFKKIYTRIKWSPDIAWFPSKIDNMWNHSMRAIGLNLEPFTIVRFNEYQKLVHASGPNILLIESIVRALNFSLEYVPPPAPNPSSTADLRAAIDSDLEFYQIDLVSDLSPHWIGSSENADLLTTTIMMDELCPVVPILPQVMLPLSTKFFVAYLLFFGIIVIIWILVHVLNFENYLWTLFFITRVLFGISVTRQPTVNPERIIFTSLMVVSAIYSSDIYSALTEISLQTNAEMEFNSFDDLDNSGFTPVINPYIFEEIFSNADGALINLKKKSIQSKPGENVFNCPLFAAKHQNITCIINKRKGEVAAALTQRDGRARLKIVKPCFGLHSWAFLIGSKSPYRSSINSVIQRMQSAGLVDKFYEDQIVFSKLRNDEEESVPEDKQNMIALRQQLLAIFITGYTISLLVFIAEIIVNFISKYKKS